MKAKKNQRRHGKEITDYDDADTTVMINADKPLHFADLGLKLPANPPTQVVSIRLPTRLLNKIKALGSQRDVPYQALIKLFLSKAVEKY